LQPNIAGSSDEIGFIDRAHAANAVHGDSIGGDQAISGRAMAIGSRM
jgi:hypothetical protein